jgi:hypothetical protein
MASSYGGRLDTKMTSLRSVCRKYLGLTIPRYDYGPANLVGRPGCVTYRGWCALVALPACSGHPSFYVGNEGLPVGCAPNGPAKLSGAETCTDPQGGYPSGFRFTNGGIMT